MKPSPRRVLVMVVAAICLFVWLAVSIYMLDAPPEFRATLNSARLGMFFAMAACGVWLKYAKSKPRK